MKFSSYLTLFAATLASVSAHSSMKNPLPRAHPLNPNAATKDFACITAPFNGGAGCAPKPFPCGGYPVDTKITQVLSAGDVINVSFWNPNFPNGPSPSDAQSDQARHNGGLCEFALSYDGGVTYTVIATYHETCPDIFFDWKVKIPENAPSCDNPGKCLFSWSWINAVGNREFYQNCADVKIQGNSTKPLPIKDITRANLPPLFPTIDSPTGDPANSGNEKGSGPLQSDVSANLALTFDSGSGDTSPAPDTTSPDTTSPTPDTTDSTDSTDSTGNSTDTSPTSDTTSSDSTSTDSTSCRKKRGKKGRNGSNCSPTNSPPSSTTSSSLSSSDGSCTDGEMKCTPDGAFTTCTNGILVTRQCPSATVCMPSGDSITCGWPTRKL